jgi:hypothetical protein
MANLKVTSQCGSSYLGYHITTLTNYVRDGDIETVQRIIFSGEDECSMHRAFKKLIGPDTEVHIDPYLKDQ